ncbi:hypothetical protein GCM10009634_73630 [Saccharothrix xinjiangensis]
MAGALQPTDYPVNDPLMKTYKAAVRAAFQKEIDEGDQARDQISSIVENPTNNPEDAADDAFAQAAAAVKHRLSRNRVHLEHLTAHLGGFKPRNRDELRSEHEQALLSAVGLRPPEWDRSDGERDFEEIWHNGHVPLDARIFAQRPCDTCASRTTSMPTSRVGQREILNSACFCQLNRARAIGGAVSMLIANVRDLVLQNPDDQFLQSIVNICSNTALRFLLREPRKVAPSRPESIVPSTLFFLHDCRWLRSGAALLTQIALLRLSDANVHASIPAFVARAMSEAMRRGRLLRSDGGVELLLALDGTVHAAELLKLSEQHHR